MWMFDPQQQMTSTTLARAIQDDAVFDGGKSLYMRDRRTQPQDNWGRSEHEMIPIFSVNAFYVDRGVFQVSVPSGFGEIPSLGCDISHLDADAEVFIA